MTATYLGALTLGAALPGLPVVSAAAAAGISAALPDLLERIASLKAFAPAPVSFSAQLTLAKQVVASIEQSIALGISPPSITAQIAAVTGLITQLLASVSQVNAQLSIVQEFTQLFASAGIHAFVYEGAVGDLPGELAGALDAVPGLATGDSAHAAVLLTTSGTTWSALGRVVRVTS